MLELTLIVWQSAKIGLDGLENGVLWVADIILTGVYC